MASEQDHPTKKPPLKSYLRMRKTDILHRPCFNILKEMETYVAISLFVCLSEVSVDFFGCLKVIYFAV